MPQTKYAVVSLLAALGTPSLTFRYTVRHWQFNLSACRKRPIERAVTLLFFRVILFYLIIYFF